LAALSARTAGDEGAGYLSVASTDAANTEHGAVNAYGKVQHALEAKRSLALQSFMARRSSEKTRQESSKDAKSAVTLSRKKSLRDATASRRVSKETTAGVHVRAAGMVFDQLDGDKSGSISKLEIIEFANGHNLPVSALTDALSIKGEYIVTKELFITKYERGELPQGVTQIVEDAHDGIRKSGKKETPSPELAIRIETFHNWVNFKLQDYHEVVPPIPSLDEGLKDGTTLIRLVEMLTGESCPMPWNKDPQGSSAEIKDQALQNLNFALQFLEGVLPKLVRGHNIVPDDIYDGDSESIMHIVWSLILHLDVMPGLAEDPKQANDRLIEWIQSKIPDSGAFTQTPHCTSWLGSDTDKTKCKEQKAQAQAQA